MAKTSGNILFSGVGGQGILLASEITSYALMKAGFDLKKSEVHGMAQRGGSVVAHLKYGAKVYSPLIEPGGADMEVAFELMEAIRYLPFLNKDSKVIVNTQKIYPPSVATGIETYPEGIIETMEARGLKVYAIDAFALAKEVGELRAVNMVMVGALSGFLPVGPEVFHEVINERVKKGFEKVNIMAFDKGRQFTAA